MGLVNEKNVIFVGLAGVIMLFGAMLGVWKKSLLLAPIAAALCIVPMFL
jgi:hypothetical protein